MSRRTNTGRLWRRILLAGIPLTAAAVLGGAVVAGTGGSSAVAQPPASPGASNLLALKSGPYDAETIYQRDSPGVVDIVTTEHPAGATSEELSPFGPSTAVSKAEGTGFVFNKSGDIITAAHVVSGASKIVVTFKDGTMVPATLVGSDPSNDTAVIKVSAPASELVPLTLGDSSTVQPGQGVIAIGSAFGYPETITAGIVSAVDRDISALNGYSIADAIQTDAAINHGNSGGPLINESGDVIGINDQLPVGSSANNGVGFAVPANDVRTSADDLIAGKPVEHAYLGIAITTATSEPGAAVGLVRAGSPAATAGIKAGDIVTAADSIKVTNAEQLAAIVSGHKVGDVVRLTLNRSGTTLTVDATLGVRPAAPKT